MSAPNCITKNELLLHSNSIVYLATNLEVLGCTIRDAAIASFCNLFNHFNLRLFGVSLSAQNHLSSRYCGRLKST